VGKGKLSKRDGDKMGFPVFPLEWKTAEGDVFSGYREDGYLPEAVLNMLAFLGWNPGTEQEIFSLEQLVDAFELERVNKSGAKFDPEKTKWFQHHYLQQMDEGVLTAQFKELLESKGISTTIDLSVLVSMLKERATFVSDIWTESSFFFEAPSSYDEKASKKAFKEDTAAVLQKVVELLQATDDFSATHISDIVKGWITSNEISFGKVMMPLRLSLVGEMKGPDVFEMISILGKEETLKRVHNAIESR
jgi:glutamyl-tRNA synthetase